MSSSSAVQSVILLAAITSQASAFAPPRTVPIYYGKIVVRNSLSFQNNLPEFGARRHSNGISMGLNFGRKQDKERILESTSLQSSAVALDGTPKSESKNPFTRWVQSVAWPSKKELKKLLPLGTMLFFILFNYTILRDTKVTQKNPAIAILSSLLPTNFIIAIFSGCSSGNSA